MDDERLMILTMLRDGKITAEEAEKLLAAVGTGAAQPQAPRMPRAPRPPLPPVSPYYSDRDIRRQAREVAHEVREQTRHAAHEAKEIAREAKRAAAEHARRIKHEIRRRDFLRDDDVRDLVDGISEGLREGMRGLREGLDIGMREGMRGLREGMRGLDEAMRGVREGFSDVIGDRGYGPAHREPGRFTWTPGSDRCEARAEFERVVAVPAGTGLDLSATNGDTKIVLWDEATIKVQGIKHAWGATDAEAQQRLEECDVTADVEGGWLIVRERLPQGRVFGRPSCVDFVVYVPRETALRLKAVNGDVECLEAVGRLTCRTINGDLTLGRIGAADIGSTNGDIVIEQASGSQLVANVNGDIRIGLMTAGGDTVSVSNVHGDINCEFSDGSSAALEVSTRVGDISTSRIQVEQRSGHRLTGRIGDGAGRVTLTTINGDVTIK